MKIRPVIHLVTVVFVCLFGTAMAHGEDFFPVLPGSIEKPCGNIQVGASLRMELASAKNAQEIMNQLLSLSRQSGWKMIRVSDIRYQSESSRGGYYLSWSVEDVGIDKGTGRRIYCISYWNFIPRLGKR